MYAWEEVRTEACPVERGRGASAVRDPHTNTVTTSIILGAW